MRTPKTLSIDVVALDYAENLRQLRLFPDLSTLIEQLLVEEWERRHGPATMHDMISRRTELETKLKTAASPEERRELRIQIDALTPRPIPEHSVSYKKSFPKRARKVAG